jgi:signal transduction histidine kinase
VPHIDAYSGVRWAAEEVPKSFSPLECYELYILPFEVLSSDGWGLAQRESGTVLVSCVGDVTLITGRAIPIWSNLPDDPCARLHIELSIWRSRAVCVEARRRHENLSVHHMLTAKEFPQAALQPDNEDSRLSISSRLIEAQEQERARIARELHDDFSQRMALLAIDLDLLKRDLPHLSGDALNRMDKLRKQCREIGLDIQALSHELHSASLDHLGIVAAMKGFCKEFGEKQNLKIQFLGKKLPAPVSPEVAICLYRVLQEALHNAAKHSRASQFNVQFLGTHGEIRLTVSDDGVGFDVVPVSNGLGLGLISMRERVKLVNGTFSITSKLSYGTEINVRIPVKEMPQFD